MVIFHSYVSLPEGSFHGFHPDILDSPHPIRENLTSPEKAKLKTPTYQDHGMLDFFDVSFQIPWENHVPKCFLE